MLYDGTRVAARLRLAGVSVPLLWLARDLYSAYDQTPLFLTISSTPDTALDGAAFEPGTAEPISIVLPL